MTAAMRKKETIITGDPSYKADVLFHAVVETAEIVE